MHDVKLFVNRVHDVYIGLLIEFHPSCSRHDILSAHHEFAVNIC